MLQSLWLKDFRNFDEKVVHFSDGLTTVVGPNASGKTNILEAIFLLATGKSFKARVEEEMIGYDKELARVKGKTHGSEGHVNLEILLTRGMIIRGEVTQRTARKRLLVNGVGKRLIDFASHLSVVLFRPQDMDLVTASPSHRRRFLDTVLSQTDREYRKNLLSYEKAITRRNKILFRIREEQLARSNLYFWDQLIIKHGQYLTQKRAEFLHFVNNSAKLDDKEFYLDYDKSFVSEERIAQYKSAEVSAATTLVGPHRDDVVFKVNSIKTMRELDKYGSRGEQRMAVLWAKLAELQYIKKESKVHPTLLLDDIFSELDHEHRKVVMNLISDQQTIMTTADPHFLEELKEFEKIDLEE